MNEHKNYLPSKEDYAAYTLFLDRDGVINEPIVDDYARKPADFILCEGAIDALNELKVIFKRVIVVTNQQGVGRGVMSERDLEDVHLKMYDSMKDAGVEYFDAAFFAPYLRDANHTWRKPSNGMYMKTLDYFDDLDFDKAIMVGDSPGDMALADTVGLLKVKISNPQFNFDNQDVQFDSLKAFVDCLS